MRVIIFFIDFWEKFSKIYSHKGSLHTMNINMMKVDTTGVDTMNINPTNIEKKINESEIFDSKTEMQEYLLDYKLEAETIVERTEYIILMHLTLMKNMEVIEEDEHKEIYERARDVMNDMIEDLKELKNKDEIDIYNKCIYVLKYYMEKVENEYQF